ncbi:MAG TPA: aconitase family protein [Candidatus Limnocylindrales bacterium]|nr:aconitase family protein [Candidatus Limnocylindrales bacterium]
MTLRELTGDITYRALSDVPDGLSLTMRLLRENIARHGLPYVDGGLAFRPERVVLPEAHLRAAMVAVVALRREVADRGLPPDLVEVHVPVDSLQASEVVTLSQENVAFLDSVVGTSPDINALNGLGVLAWRVGGGQAEAVMLGQPIHLPTPRVVGVRLTGSLPPEATAADVVRGLAGVRGAFLEFHGPGADAMAVADRMALAAEVPRCDAVAGLFPIDDQTLEYLRAKGFPAEHVELTELYCREQGLFGVRAEYAELLTVDLGSVTPAFAAHAGPSSQPEIVVPELHPARRPRDLTGARVLLGLGDGAAPDLDSLRNERKAHPLGDVPLALVTGADYGGGDVSSDWAGRGTRQLGIRVVVSKDFLGTHRADLVCAGVLPLQAKADLHGDETLTITGIADIRPGGPIAIDVAGPDGRRLRLPAVVRLDNRRELEWFRHGGILPYVLDKLVEAAR